MFEKSGRKNIEAWTAAVISGNPTARVDARVLEQITEQQITNDCRVIEESLGIIASTRNPDTRASRERLVQDRLVHLRTLIPYADKKQAKKIQEAERKCR